MNHELLVSLKRAGWPQIRVDAEFVVNDDGNLATIELNQGKYTIPTLSELIEACGDDFLGLTHTPFHPTPSIPADSMPMEWMSLGGKNMGTHFSYQQSGHSPEEAVARLWLALSKK